MTNEPLALRDAEINALLSRRTNEVQGLARAMRDRIRKAVPNAVEIIYHGALCYGTSPRRSMLRVYLSFHRSHVNLGFYFGATLPDPDRLLIGDGKRMRHVKITNQQDIHRRALKRLIRTALQQD
jgi:hypothetical protein